jgi:hypothetical protein
MGSSPGNAWRATGYEKATTPGGAVEFREETPTVTNRRGSDIIVAPSLYQVKCYFFYNVVRKCNMVSTEINARAATRLSSRRAVCRDTLLLHQGDRGKSHGTGREWEDTSSQRDAAECKFLISTRRNTGLLPRCR